MADPPAPPSWLVNPGFEEVNDEGKPANWHITQQDPGYALSFDTETVHSSTQSLRLDLDASRARNPDGPHGFFISAHIPARFRAGERYTVSGYVKLEGLGPKGRTEIQLYQYPAPFPPEARSKSPGVRGDTDWTRIVLPFTAREGIGNLSVGISVYWVGNITGGVAWLDSFKVEPGGEATAYTDEVDADFYPYSGRPPDHFSVQLDYRASTDTVTPHAEPARGRTARPLKAMFIAHPNHMRWPAEIAQRSGITFESAAVNGKTTGYKQGHVHECIEIMTERLQAADPEVIVMYPDAFELLIERDRKAILERVRQGAGLMLFDLVNTHRTLVTDLIPDAEAILGNDGKPRRYGNHIAAYTLGKGRVVTAGRMPMKNTNTFLREALADQMVRATYIAGGFEPAPMEIVPSAPLLEAGQAWSVTCTGNVAAAQWRVRLRPVRRTTSFNRASEPADVIYEQMLPGGLTAVASMPPQASGSYMVEATALDADGRAMGWALRALPCDGPVRIDSIDTSGARIGEDGELRATVVVVCGEGAPDALTLTTEARDTNDRLLASGAPRTVALEHGRNELPVTLAVPATTTPQVRLCVTLRRGEAQVARREARCSGESLLREPDYRFAFYNEYAAGLASIGADTVVSRKPAATDLGFRLYPWLDVIPYGRTAGAVREEDVITSPETQQRLRGAVQETLREFKPFDSVAAIAIDEWAFDELREQDTDANLAFFREYLREVYGRIDALNQSWQTQLRAFEDVTFDLCDTEHIRYDGAPITRWGDMQAMKEAAVTTYFGLLVEAGKAVEPDFRLGLSGTRDTTGINGLDWWQLMQFQCSIAAYGGLQMRLHESFALPGAKLHRWSYVTRDNIPRGLFDPWWWLFKGHDGYLHYGGRHSDLFKPCYAPHPAAEVVGRMIAQIRSGPARLLRGAVRDDNAIGLLYSPASYRLPIVSRFLPAREAGFSNDLGLSYDRALADSGLDSHWYSYEEVAAGALGTEKVRAFFLPASGAMSDGEVEAVRRFVRGGGVVIADVRPARYDERLRRRPAAALNDVFGLGPCVEGVGLEDAKVIVNSGGALAVRAGEWDLALQEGAEALAQVTAEEDRSAPAVVVHAYGKGKAILLNFMVADYARYRAGGVGGEIGEESSTATAGPLRPLLRDLLAEHAGVRPSAYVVDRADLPLPRSRVFTYRDGDVRYIGYIQHFGEREDPLLTTPARLHLAEAGHLYDVLAHEDLGDRAVHELEITEANARLFALMPYKIGRVTADAPRRVQRGDLVKITATVRGASQRHVFRVEIADPDGVVHPWHRFTMEGARGTASDRVHIALDAPTGRWTVTVTEVVSGQRERVRFEVE